MKMGQHLPANVSIFWVPCRYERAASGPTPVNAIETKNTMRHPWCSAASVHAHNLRRKKTSLVFPLVKPSHERAHVTSDAGHQAQKQEALADVRIALEPVVHDSGNTGRDQPSVQLVSTRVFEIERALAYQPMPT